MDEQQGQGQVPPQNPEIIAPTIQQPQTVGYPTQPVADNSAKITAFDAAMKSGGNWFYWIAGLSLVNTIVALANGKFYFVLGLGITSIIDGIAQEIGHGAALIALPVNLIIAAVYVTFGYCACRRAKWAFIVGIIFYSLDSVLMLVAGEWLGLAFHAYALYCIGRGMKALSMIKQLESSKSYPYV